MDPLYFAPAPILELTPYFTIKLINRECEQVSLIRVVALRDCRVQGQKLGRMMDSGPLLGDLFLALLPRK